MTPEATDLGLWELASRARIVDLGQPIRVGMPQSPNHSQFRLILDRRHGDVVHADGGSMANEVIVMPGHLGTHVDALGHVSHEGMVYGDLDSKQIQSQAGLSARGIDEFRPFVGRGVMLDVAAVHDVATLPAGYEVSAADLEAAQERGGVAVRAGDAVLIATGWSRNWTDPATFVGLENGTPGPGEEAAYWLAERRPIVAGAETVAFEQIRPGLGHTRLPAHRVLLREHGINIIEMLRLDDLVAEGVSAFTLILNPLSFVGATGAPVRPLALIESTT